MRFWKFHIAPTFRFYIGLLLIALLFGLAFIVPALLVVGQLLLFLWIALSVYDGLILSKLLPLLQAQREVPKSLSLGYEHSIHLSIINNSDRMLQLTCIDEIPVELQQRDNHFEKIIARGGRVEHTYLITPPSRGTYTFGDIILLIRSWIGLIEFKETRSTSVALSVFPSIKEMQDFEWKTFSANAVQGGIKRIRRVGQSHEFDHIKSYVQGDDFQKINWKASGRGQGLMVNNYEDERSQPIYLIIDKSRSMKMPFENLTLISYAINATLALSNIVLKKYDRPGLLTFAAQPETFIKADRSRLQLKRILNALHAQKEGKSEANFEKLYLSVRSKIPNRSLLFLFTNFESKYAMERVLPILRLIDRRHLLVCILFKNTEVEQIREQPIEDLQQVYDQTMAEKYVHEKHLTIYALKQAGIHTLYVKPQELSAAVINKYLELKARVLI